MSDAYDVIVVGLGAAGSAAAYHLTRRGQRVLGLDMFEPGHDQGSSHGYHRMIRRSSFQDDGYVPLAERALELWHELEAESDRNLVTFLGEVRMGYPADDRQLLAGGEEMIRRGFWEPLTKEDLAARFPGFHLHDGMVAAYEAEAGFIRSEVGVITHVDMAARHGATIHPSEEVTNWEADGDGVLVETRRGSYTAGRLVLTTGPWAAELLSSLNLPMRVERTVNGYFEPARPDWWDAANGAPDFILSVPEGSFYGTPALQGVGLKIGRSGGIGGSEVTTPRTIRRTIDDSEIQMLRDVLDKYMPGAAGRELKRITCMGTYTADKDFIVDHHPVHSQVLIGCGFSGRGYKFAPVTGEILATLASGDRPRHDIGFLSAGRFQAEAAD